MRRRRNHHTFAGRQIERFSGSEIDSRFWFVVANNLGAENGVETKLVAPSEIGHQRDVGIGNWRQQEIIGQASKPGLAALERFLSCNSPPFANIFYDSKKKFNLVLI
jgi:hypothetical protein